MFLVLTNVTLPLRQKSKNDPLPESTLKDGISGITEKDNAHPRKYDIGILD